MSNPIEGLKPEGVWKYFAEISKIPRGSKNEKQIAAYVMQKAKELGLEAKQDKFMTVVVRKPASPGFAAPPCAWAASPLREYSPPVSSLRLSSRCLSHPGWVASPVAMTSRPLPLAPSAIRGTFISGDTPLA